MTTGSVTTGSVTTAPDDGLRDDGLRDDGLRDDGLRGGVGGRLREIEGLRDRRRVTGLLVLLFYRRGGFERGGKHGLDTPRRLLGVAALPARRPRLANDDRLDQGLGEELGLAFDRVKGHDVSGALWFDDDGVGDRFGLGDDFRLGDRFGLGDDFRLGHRFGFGDALWFDDGFGCDDNRVEDRFGLGDRLRTGPGANVSMIGSRAMIGSGSAKTSRPGDLLRLDDDSFGNDLGFEDDVGLDGRREAGIEERRCARLVVFRRPSRIATTRARVRRLRFSFVDNEIGIGREERGRRRGVCVPRGFFRLAAIAIARRVSQR